MSAEGFSDFSFERLRDLRQGLLQLHKLLLETERRTYERSRGRISNSYEYLQLVMRDPWFAWLHSLSELIVQIDELFDAEEPMPQSSALALIDQIRDLLSPSETGVGFQRKYFEALQQSADVVLTHSRLIRLLGRRSNREGEVH